MSDDLPINGTPNWRNPNVKILRLRFLLGLARVFVSYFLISYIIAASVISFDWLIDPQIRAPYPTFGRYFWIRMTDSLTIQLGLIAGTFMVVMAICYVTWSRLYGWNRRNRNTTDQPLRQPKHGP
jgi:hypothetical protein